MKFTITMKDPDGFYDSLGEAVKESLADQEGLDEEERDLLTESREDDLKQLLKTWFRYDEYLTVEVDTVAKTCTVVKAK